MIFIVCLGALIKHKIFQSDNSTKFTIKFTMKITIENKPKNRISLKKNISDGPSATLKLLFNSNVTKVYVIKWSQNYTRAIRSGVFGIAKNGKITCFACIFQIFGYANKTTSDGPSAILRPLYNRYFCHITIEKWSQICTKTIRNVFFKDILFLVLFPIVIPIVNLIANLNHEEVELSLWNFCGWSVHPNKQ